MTGPGDDHRVARAAEMASNLLRPPERRVHGVGPGSREVVEVRWPAQFVDHLEGVLPFFDKAVEEQVLID